MGNIPDELHSHQCEGHRVDGQACQQMVRNDSNHCEAGHPNKIRTSVVPQCRSDAHTYGHPRLIRYWGQAHLPVWELECTSCGHSEERLGDFKHSLTVDRSIHVEEEILFSVDDLAPPVVLEESGWETSIETRGYKDGPRLVRETSQFIECVEFQCAECGWPMFYDENGVAYHGEDGAIDHDLDADHTALDEAAYEASIPPLLELLGAVRSGLPKSVSRMGADR